MWGYDWYYDFESAYSFFPAFFLTNLFIDYWFVQADILLYYSATLIVTFPGIYKVQRELKRFEKDMQKKLKIPKLGNDNLLIGRPFYATLGPCFPFKNFICTFDT